MSGLIAMGTLAALLIFALGWGLNTCQRLSGEGRQVDSRWHQLDRVLRQRSDLIPGLVALVKGHAVPETQLLDRVTRARSRYLAAQDPEEAVQAAARLSETMGEFFAMAESCLELKTDRRFLDLQEAYFGLETGADNLRRAYNGAVLHYNHLVGSFPASLIAGLFRFRKRSCYGPGPGEQER